MRIGISSTQCNGKTTLLEAFKAKWPKYKSPDKTYRDLIKEKGLSLNELGDMESQKIIRDSLCDTALNNAAEKHMIHDRSILDNIAYTLWLAEKDKIKDANFVADSINLCRETLKFFDIIIWLPLNPDISVSDSNNENRSTDETFRMEIDAIFDGIFTSYQQGSGLIFPLEDSPCMLKIEGDVSQKIEEIAQYLNADGDLIETEESVIEQLTELAEKFDLLNQVKNG